MNLFHNKNEGPPEFNGDLKEVFSNPKTLYEAFNRAPNDERLALAKSLFGLVKAQTGFENPTQHSAGSYKDKEKFETRTDKPQIFFEQVKDENGRAKNQGVFVVRLNNGTPQKGYKDGTTLVMLAEIDPKTGSPKEGGKTVCDLMTEKDFGQYRSIWARWFGVGTSREWKLNNLHAGFMTRVIDGSTDIESYEQVVISHYNWEVGGEDPKKRKRVFKTMWDVLTYEDEFFGRNDYDQNESEWYFYRKELITAMNEQIKTIKGETAEKVEHVVRGAGARLALAREKRAGRRRRLATA